MAEVVCKTFLEAGYLGISFRKGELGKNEKKQMAGVGVKSCCELSKSEVQLKGM